MYFFQCNANKWLVFNNLVLGFKMSEVKIMVNQIETSDVRFIYENHP